MMLLCRDNERSSLLVAPKGIVDERGGGGGGGRYILVYGRWRDLLRNGEGRKEEEEEEGEDEDEDEDEEGCSSRRRQGWEKKSKIRYG